MKILVKERNEIGLFLYSSMVLAIGLGVYAQDIAYFLYNNLAIHLIVGLSIATILSVFLFLTTSTLIYKLNKKQKIGDKEDISVQFSDVIKDNF